MPIKNAFNFIASLRLTVVLLFMAMMLVFVGTLAQVKLGLYSAQEAYFRSLLIYWGPKGAGWKVPVFPGGYLLGILLLTNLIAAHFKRFRPSRRIWGIALIHGGMVLLLLGQFFSEVWSTESSMRLVEGQTSNYSQDFKLNELAVIDTSDREKDKVVSFPESSLAGGGELRHASLPFKLRPRHYWQNAELVTKPAEGAVATGVTNGVGLGVFVIGKPPATKTDERNLPSAVVEVLTDSGSLGSWLLSPVIARQQTFSHEGKTYRIEMRFRRHYKPFEMKLIDFRHDKYMGTDIPKNFSSRIQLRNPASGEDREVLIYMNNPLRYQGETFYQGSYDPRDERVSILQVVRNPSWLTPYVACTLVGLGLTVQFMSHLLGFIRKRKIA